MKKIIKVLLGLFVCTLVLGIASCKDQDEGKNNSISNSEQSVEENKNSSSNGENDSTNPNTGALK